MNDFSRPRPLSCVSSAALCGIAAALLSGCGGSGGSDSPPTAASKALTCDESMKAAFKPDALTTVVAVNAYKKGDALPNAHFFDKSKTVGADLCLVKLVVGPGNPGPVDAPSTSSGIGIEIWLPTKAAWNGRIHAIGNGAWAGSAESDPAKISNFSIASDYRSAFGIAATENAVVSNSDTGHYIKSDFAFAFGNFAMNPDGTINTTLWNDFASRGNHEQVVKTKALVAAYYGTSAKFTYWDGGSTGGRQALKQAQAYPEDFDGIIAGFPAINWNSLAGSVLYPHVVMQRDLGGVLLTTAQQNLVSNAAISACDVVGGQHLGFPLDPSACRYNPVKDTSVLCTLSGGTNTTPDCVSTVQAQAINKMWYGMTADGSVPDPAVDNGWALQPTGLQRWYGLSRGTSLLSLAGPLPKEVGVHHLALELQDPTLADATFTNATGNGLDRWKGLSYAQYSAAFDRGAALNPVFGNINTDDPDLARFKARGGKLLHIHGLADPQIFPQGSIHYYERVLSRMGGLANVQSFYKFYLVPGMGHGPGNGTTNPAANPPSPAAGQMYKLLTDWVENGIEPNNITIDSASGTPAKSAPMCAYPKKITYKGSGDINVAASFTCI